MTNICFSGGATGADSVWTEVALAAGHEVVNYIFKGHKGFNKPGAVILTQEQADEADPHLAMANQVLKRSWPAHSDFVCNLLRRNYWQVRDSGAVYAVTGLDGNSVLGGTAWAVEMFKNLHPDKPIYVFDYVKDSWFSWSGMGWTKLDGRPPRPKGRWTGIGSRELHPKAKLEMQEFMSD